MHGEGDLRDVVRCSALCRMGMRDGRRLRTRGLVFDRGPVSQVPLVKLHAKSGIGRVLTACGGGRGGARGGGGGQNFIEYFKA